ncbi:ATP-binding cassette domain-containing protein [Ornithinimicrobium tianjinense]|uniref:ATP-binding cassette domain-containing protein n=1 Tax=Ornithinimicrobium tianjinense TaxID=1195761 RepID=UPI001664FA4F|nr:ABC transporter ATP-binding protein [Ornithinimicrobium tianjinense]
MTADLGASRVGLIGLNGAGKSTLIESLAGRLTFRGTLLFDGRPMAHLPPTLTGYVPQQVAHPGLVSVRECVAAAADLKKVAPQRREEWVSSALAAVDLEGEAGRRASRLSGGQSRRLACAMALVHRPEILLLDEPTAGLDPVQRRGIRDFLHQRPTGTLTVVSTHILEDVADWAERLLVLRSGELVADVALTSIPAAERLAQVDALLQSLAVTRQ